MLCQACVAASYQQLCCRTLLAGQHLSRRPPAAAADVYIQASSRPSYLCKQGQCFTIESLLQ